MTHLTEGKMILGCVENKQSTCFLHNVTQMLTEASRYNINKWLTNNIRADH